MYQENGWYLVELAMTLRGQYHCYVSKQCHGKLSPHVAEVEPVINNHNGIS